MSIQKMIALVLCIVSLTNTVAFATEKQGIPLSAFLNVGNFDAKAYASNYPDVAAVYGKDTAALLGHYLQYGYNLGYTATGRNDATTAKIMAFRIAHEIVTEDMSTYDKVKAVHDWIIVHTEYDYDRYMNNTAPTSSYYIAGVMLDGIGVCAGYADTFQFFMDVLGIESSVIYGEATSGSTTGSHSWNQVCVDGNWYNVDVTWDDGKEDISYNYFLVSNQEIGKNHATKQWQHKCEKNYNSEKM